MDKLVLAVFVDCVGVGFARGEHVAYLLLRVGGVILEKVVAYYVAVALEGLAGALVHEKDFSLGVADGYGAVYTFGPVEWCVHASLMLYVCGVYVEKKSGIFSGREDTGLWLFLFACLKQEFTS